MGLAVFVCEVAAMEVSQKKPAAGAPAAKEPAPTLASGKYTFSKAEALRRYVLRKQHKSGKGVSAAKRAENKKKALYVEKPFNKGTRIVSLKKRPNNYPVKTLLRKKSKVVKRVGAPKVRQSLTPGTVLILLAGVHRGKRVVLLKSLKSGLLLSLVLTRSTECQFVVFTNTTLLPPALNWLLTKLRFPPVSMTLTSAESAKSV